MEHAGTCLLEGEGSFISQQQGKGVSQRRRDRQEGRTDDSSKLFLAIPLALLASWREKKQKEGVSRKDAKSAKSEGETRYMGPFERGLLGALGVLARGDFEVIAV
jgi:hypothetical protein